MPTVPASRLRELLAPFFFEPLPASALRIQPLEQLLDPLSTYLDLLIRWNARTNLTAVREPEEMVTRHFGESLYAGLALAEVLQPGDSVLDYGSGAGFPGLPIQLLLPELRVTLAESQNKKASFLREAVRTLGLQQTEVWPKRVEEMPLDRRFSAVTLRAVDDMSTALSQAPARILPGGWLFSLQSEPSPRKIPNSQNRFLTVQQF